MAAYFGSATNPADNAGLIGTTPVTITPPGSMVSGHLVTVLVTYRGNADTIAVSQAGGQTWTSETARSGNTQTSRLFHCIFNGTWSADPSWSNGGVEVVSAVMHVFAPTASYAWSATPDTAAASASAAAPGTPFDCTITGFTPTEARTVSLFFWSSVDDNTWALQTGGFTNAGSAYYRNNSTNDMSNSAAYLIQTTATATGDVTNRQATNGGDNFHTWSIAFDETPATTLYVKLFAEAAAASAASIEGVVLNAARDTVIGEFTGQAFDVALEGGEAVLLIDVADITPDGSTLTTSDTPIVFAYNTTDSIIGPGSATVVEV